MKYEPRTQQPQAWFADDWLESSRTTITVHEAENAHERTGLLDANGTPIYRVRETVKMGFCR